MKEKQRRGPTRLQNARQKQSPEKPANEVTVIHGIHRLTLKIAGKSVEDVRKSLKTALNIEEQADTLVNGKQVEKSYILKKNDVLEFVRLAGSKG